MSPTMDSALGGEVERWYADNARDLPWRRPDVSPWAVLVSEVMLQQTPAARVIPAWQEWMQRWPTPADLAAQPAGEAVRAWGRLGYPRRALRLHAAARAVVEHHSGVVPDDEMALRALPGVGAYTAAAVASFAFGRPPAGLDTNVRRVYARFFDGAEDATGSPTVAEATIALSRVPEAGSAVYNVAVMELGALLCRARSPLCESCPVVTRCAWRAAGRPAASVKRRGQTYAGTDRQARGHLLAVLRDSARPVTTAALDAAWHDGTQRARALDGLVADGLVEPLSDGRYRLPA